MKCANAEYTTELLRAELIHRIERGETSAKRLLSGLADHRGTSVTDLINQNYRTAGPLVLERILFYLGMLSLGLAFGILALTALELVAPELDSLALSIGAFLLSNASLSQYNKHSEARFLANGFSRILSEVAAPETGRRRAA